MDQQQRRVWQHMLSALDEYQAGTLPLATLVVDLPGHLSAADVRKREWIDGFWDVFQAIEAEHELRTEPWAPPNLASDEHLAKAVEQFRAWANSVLANATDGGE